VDKEQLERFAEQPEMVLDPEDVPLAVELGGGPRVNVLS
jgi:hypothetical protein